MPFPVFSSFTWNLLSFFSLFYFTFLTFFSSLSLETAFLILMGRPPIYFPFIWLMAFFICSFVSNRTYPIPMLSKFYLLLMTLTALTTPIGLNASHSYWSLILRGKFPINIVVSQSRSYSLQRVTLILLSPILSPLAAQAAVAYSIFSYFTQAFIESAPS